jgi:glycosyltransferase involved in cell wall biosynthesis
LQLEHVRARADEFDVLHFHFDYLHLPMVRALGLRNTVTTMHGPSRPRRISGSSTSVLRRGTGVHSDQQRRPLPHCNWAGTVYHGLPADVCRFEPHSNGGYLAFLGRISPEKRVDRAIEIAGRAGMKLRIAAKVDAADRKYFHESIEPLLTQPHVEFVGEIGEREKRDFLGQRAYYYSPSTGRNRSGW